MRSKLEIVESREVLLRETVAQQQQTATFGLAIVGLLVTAVGLLLPVVTYMTSILPGQQAAKDARRAVREARGAVEGLDARFADLTASYRQDEMNRAIANLESTGLEQSVALQHIILHHNGELTSKQIFDIADVARRVEDAVRLQLVSILAHYISPYTTRLMLDLLVGDKPRSYLQPILRHCEIAGNRSMELKEALRAWSKTEDRGLLLLLYSAMQYSRSFLIELLEDSTWHEYFSIDSRVLALHSLVTPSKAAGLFETVKASALFRSAGLRHEIFVDHGDQLKPPAEAAFLKVFDGGVLLGTYIKSQAEFRAAAARYAEAHDPPPSSASDS